MTEPAPAPHGALVDLASRAIVQVGFPIVVAGVLLWFLLTTFQSNMNLIVERMSENTKATTALIDTSSKLIAASDKEFDELRRQSDQLATQTAYLRTLVEDSAKVLALHQAQRPHGGGGAP